VSETEMIKQTVTAMCNHCNQGFESRSGNEGLCAPCFIKGHRGRRCDKYCQPSPRKYPDMTQVFERVDRRHEWQRLKDSVVEAAKVWYHAELEKTAAERTLEDELEPRLVLAEATSALLQFEQEQK